MANERFDPQMSSDKIWHGDQQERCITDDLETLEQNVTALQTGKAPTNHEHTGYAASDHTHTGFAAENHTHTGFAAENHTHTGFAAESHVHEISNITGLLNLLLTSATGDIKASFTGQDVLDAIKALPSGMHTAYCPVNTANAPKSTESWRFLIHKTGSTNYGWVLAFGSRGSVYSNYIDSGNWRGWKCIHDIEPDPLWTGAIYLTAGHTVTPTKTLSACRNGWLLLWSDYDPGEGENNYDFSVTMIPKRAYTGQKWAGGQFLCMVPCHYAADGQNHITKCLHIHDNKIVGHESNTAVNRNDVVLRAVYEF